MKKLFLFLFALISVTTFSQNVVTVSANTTVNLATQVTGTLATTNGGTGLATYSQGDILYSSATNTLSKLAAGTNGYSLVSGGSGANPLYVQKDNREVLGYQALGSTIVGQTIGVTNQTANTSTGLTSGQARFIAVWVDNPCTITGVMYNQFTAGTGTWDANDYVALYTYSSGTLTQVKISTNDATNIWKQTAGTQYKVAFSGGAYTASRGLYYVGLLYHSSTQTIQPFIGAQTAVANINQNILDFTNSACVSFTLSSQTTLQSSISTTSLSTSSTLPWVALY